MHTINYHKSVMALFLILTLIFVTGAANGIPNLVQPKQVYTYEIMVRDMKRLASNYPELIRYRSIGQSEYGRNLWLIEVGNGPVNIVLNGSHHAREWITTITLMEMVESMARKEQAGYVWHDLRTNDLFDHVTFHIVPMVNPDGVTLQQKGLKAFPKKDHGAIVRMNEGSYNFERWKANAKGIDLNRQYPAGWKTIRDPEPAPSYMNYKGKKPLEAKEAKAMVTLTKELKPELAVSYHSSGEILYWSYNTESANIKRDRELAEAYSALTGYRVVKPVKNPSGGGYTDWFITEFGKPALTPELGKPAGESDVALSQWDYIWKQHQSTPWLLGSRALDLWMQEQKPVIAEGQVELEQDTRTYQWPILDNDTFLKLPSGIYTKTREKGNWIEVETEQGHRWLASRFVSRVVQPEPVQETVGEVGAVQEAGAASTEQK